jgi:hypothetical protein
MALTAERVRQLLNYDPASGAFTWRVSPRARKRAGDEAGSIDGRYLRLQINQTRYAAHRVAWLIMTGDWPSGEIDHIDRNPFNNSWSNLRLCTPSQNAANRTKRCNNRSGLKGVSLCQNGKWYASIKKDGRSRNLGYFTSKEDAHAAYCAAATTLFGEFARAQ